MQSTYKLPLTPCRSRIMRFPNAKTRAKLVEELISWETFGHDIDKQTDDSRGGAELGTCPKETISHTK